VDQTPNVPIDRQTLYHWAIAVPDIKLIVIPEFLSKLQQNEIDFAARGNLC